MPWRRFSDSTIKSLRESALPFRSYRMDHLAQDPDQKKLSGKHFPRLIHFLDLRIPEDLSLMVPCQDVSNLDRIFGASVRKLLTIVSNA
jgi:hypothetical protein